MGVQVLSMKKHVIVVVPFVAGLLGGLLARYAEPPTAFAQDQAPVAKEIRAQSFTLVDSHDVAMGTFTVRSEPGTQTVTLPGGRRVPMHSRIVLVDPVGQEIWSANGNLFRPLSANAR
jgi:hypothetical protein